MQAPPTQSAPPALRSVAIALLSLLLGVGCPAVDDGGVMSTGPVDPTGAYTQSRTPVVDTDDHHLFASLGCAAENLNLAAGAAGKAGEISFDPTGEGTVVYTYGSGAGANSDLFAAIPTRQSTRADYDGTPVSADDLRLLAQAAAVLGESFRVSAVSVSCSLSRTSVALMSFGCVHELLLSIHELAPTKTSAVFVSFCSVLLVLV